MKKPESGLEIDEKTGSFKIDGEKHEDSIIDLALTLTQPRKKGPKKHNPVTMKNFGGVARALSKRHFPSFMITNRDRLRDYNKVYEEMHDKDFGEQGSDFVDWPQRKR